MKPLVITESKHMQYSMRNETHECGQWNEKCFGVFKGKNIFNEAIVIV